MDPNEINITEPQKEPIKQSADLLSIVEVMEYDDNKGDETILLDGCGCCSTPSTDYLHKLKEMINLANSASGNYEEGNERYILKSGGTKI